MIQIPMIIAGAATFSLYLALLADGINFTWTCLWLALAASYVVAKFFERNK